MAGGGVRLRTEASTAVRLRSASSCSIGPGGNTAERNAPLRILLLEDHPTLRQMIADHLAQRGFAVDAVERGEEAIAAVDAAPYDALILDLGLPDLDGMEVLAAVQERTSGGLLTLVVTARDALEDRVAGLDAGADDYIVKPFALAELEARLRAVLRRPG